MSFQGSDSGGRGPQSADTTIMGAIAAASLDALITIDAEGHIVEFGPAAETLFGYRRDEVMGRSVAEIVIPPRMRSAHEEGMQRYHATGHGPVLNQRVEVPAIRRDGSEFPAELTVVPLQVNGESLFTAFVRDISKRKAYEEQLRAATEKAERANAAKSRFLAHMSHELRSPLNAVLTAIDLMLDSPLAPEQRGYARTVQTSGQALLGLINDVLDFSRIEAGQHQLADEPVDLTALTVGLAESARLTAHEKGLEFGIYIGPRVPHVVRGDPGRLRQILANLCDNALKFTHSGGVALTVDVSNETDERVRLRFEVEDTGIGIAPAQQDLIFQEFAQVDDSDSAAHGGAGLGLTIVRRLVESMNGEIGLDSAEGLGSRFWVEIESPVLRPRHPPIPLPAGLHVGVLSPNPVLRSVLGRQLAAVGLNVVESEDVAALEQAELQAATIIFADAEGLGISSSALAAAAQQAGIYPGNVYPLCTPEDGQITIGSGLGPMLFKPVQPAALYAAVNGGLMNAEAGFRADLADPDKAETAPGRGSHLLLVEDSPTNQLLAAALLRKAGFTVEVANNGHEAVEAVAGGAFDLVLMDLRMPVLNGLEAAREIRRLPGPQANVPIIALTANAMTEDVERCLAAGMNDYASKPINRGVLLDKISALLGASLQAGRPGA